MLKKKNRHENLINSITSSNLDITKRVISGQGGEITLLFIKELTDRERLSNEAIKPLSKYISQNKKPPDANLAMTGIIKTDDCKLEQEQNKILEIILAGFVVVLFPDDSNYLCLDYKTVAKKSISDPELMYTLRGPRDCFIENIDTNISLIRYRIKDPSLKIDSMYVGRRTKTKVAVLYIGDIANPKLVQDITTRIKSIDVDGIIESGELQAFLLNNKLNLFPQMGLVERSDMAAGALLEGKVIIIVEGSHLVLVAPKTMGEFLTSCDDFYDNKYIGLFAKTLRIVAFVFAITLSSLFIAISSFNHDLLPPDYILTIAMSRSGVPYSSVVGVLLLETVMEIIREALLRVPKQIGSAVGIVGGIIIGQASIAAGIFSPLLLILVSLAFISSFVAPDYSIVNPLRILKFLCIALTAVFGIIGLILAICFIVTKLISTNSFGTPIFTPLAPFNWYDLSRTFLYSKEVAPKRPGYLQVKDQYRINQNKQQNDKNPPA